VTLGLPLAHPHHDYYYYYYYYYYEVSNHKSKTSAKDFSPLAFGTVLTQHVVSAYKLALL